jgi:hypothetical protein
MKKVFIIAYLLLLLLLMVACNQAKQNETSKNSEKQESVDTENTISFKAEDYKAEEIIFYNLFSPVELTYLVSKKESYYNSSLLNPLNNITKYNQSAKVALNLGIYGADISYLWMFEQSQQALSYRAAIQRLTDQLDIPRQMVNLTYANAESNSQNFDSLVYIAKVAYSQSDHFLKETGRNHSASLVLLGGWIETLYIATQMYEKPDSKLMGKIAIQQFSLNSLMGLLQQSNENIDVSEYLLLLKKLKKEFDDLALQFPPESLVIDTSSKHITLISHESLNLKVEDLSEIRKVTRQIRNHIIQ